MKFEVPALNEGINSWKKVIKNIPNIKYLGSPGLRKKCKEITVFDSSIKRDINRLKKTFLEYREKTGFGKGMAAPQIGIFKRFVVIFTNDNVMVLANPKITSFSEELLIAEELCVSLGNLSATVIRPKFVSVQYQDETGKVLIFKGNKKESRIIQHELDHLNGVLNIDKAIKNGLRFVYDMKQLKMKDFDPDSTCPCGATKPDGRPVKYKHCCGR